MGRKTRAAAHTEKLNQAAADAAAIFTADAAGISTAIREFLASAMKTKDDWQTQSMLFEYATKLVDAQAKLGEAISKIKGEMRQQIRVTRVTDRTAIAPKSAPNFQAPRDENPSKPENNHGKDSVAPPGEGEGRPASSNGRDRRPFKPGSKIVEDLQKILDQLPT